MTRSWLVMTMTSVALSTVPQHAAAQTATAVSELQNLDRLFTAVRNRNARDYAITSAHGIDQGTYVPIGGIQQWVTIRGYDRRNPAILFLHGGPGDVTSPWGYAVFRPWLPA